MSTDRERKKLMRITTTDMSLWLLLPEQLKYLNQFFEVVGVAADTGLLEKVRDREGIRCVSIQMKREISLFNDLKSLWRFIRLFRKEKPDIIHANTPKGSLLAMMTGLLCCVPNRVYTVTGLRYQGATGVERAVLKGIERLTCLCATMVIPEGNGVKVTLQTDKITKKPLQVVHNGNVNGIHVDYFYREAYRESREDIRHKLGFSDTDFVFVFIGRIVGDKGMDELATAMSNLKRQFPKIKLLLVGEMEKGQDPISDESEEFFKNDPDVVFVGWKNDVRPFLKAADTLVFPSYREGFPRVVLEAGSMNVPSIVTNINGCNEIIIDGINGKIIPPRDTMALQNMMAWFLLHPEEVGVMSKNARSLIVSRYKREEVWDALLQIYKRL